MYRSTEEKDIKYSSDPGSRFKEVFHGEVNPDGTITLVSDGYVNIQEELESWEESTKIENIVARVDAGELQLLNQTKGFFGDVAGMPKSYPELVQMMYNAEDNFKKLPVEIRDAFNNDLNQYIAQFGTEEFYKKLEAVFKEEKGSAAGSGEKPSEKGEG